MHLSTGMHIIERTGSHPTFNDLESSLIRAPCHIALRRILHKQHRGGEQMPTFATRVAVAPDFALLGDAGFDSPVTLVGVQAVDGHDARRRLVARDRATTSVLRILAITTASTTAIASWATHRCSSGVSHALG